MNVREAVEEDLSAVVGMVAGTTRRIDEAFGKAPSAFDAERERAFFARALARDDALVLVAEGAGGVVGFVYATLHREGHDYLGTPHAVVEHLAASGANRDEANEALLAGVERWAAEHGATAVEASALHAFEGELGSLKRAGYAATEYCVAKRLGA